MNVCVQHISHPSIIAYLAAFSTPTHHALVLEYVSGGELFELVVEQHRRIRVRAARLEGVVRARDVDVDAGGVEGEAEGEEEEEVQLTEEVVRRIWGELCRAVAWMHGVGLVHRDIKLESASPPSISLSRQTK